MYLLGYIQRDSRIYLADKDVSVTSFSLSVSLLEYQTLVLREDMESAASLLPSIPVDQLNKIARFLEGQGHKEMALEVATDPEHKFELALSLGQLSTALDLARKADAEHKWKTVGDAALAAWNIPLAQECFTNAKDLGSLLLLYSSTNDRDGLSSLAETATDTGMHNIAYTARWSLGDVDACVSILNETGRTAEAVLLAQSYKPSLLPSLVSKWKETLEGQKKARVAKILGVPGPEGDVELFPEWDEWLRLEKEGTSGGAEENLMDVDVEHTAEEASVNGEEPDPDAEAVVEGSLVTAAA